MPRLSVRLKLHLLVATATAALALVGFGGWYSIDRLGDALRLIGERSLPAVSSLGALRAARLQSAQAMQDGVAWRPQQYEVVGDMSDMVEEGHFVFSDLIALTREANAAADAAFETYDALPKSATETEKWTRFKTVWTDFKLTDERQMQVAQAVAEAQDWNQISQAYQVFASQTAQWTGALSRLLPILKDLIEHNMAAAEGQRSAGEETIGSTRDLMLAVVALAVLVLSGLGLTVARSVVSTLQAIRATIAEVAASNDFTRRAPVRGGDEAAQTAEAFNQLLERVQQSLRQVAASVETMSQAAGQALDVSRRVTEAADGQREAATQMASTVDGMITRIGQISAGTRDALACAEEARQAAAAGAEGIGRSSREMDRVATEIAVAGETVGKLGHEAERITDVIRVIKEVADQTNLLALNASIEAARAGEHGRGFAVVADEVRSLAERTANSAEQIGEIIDSMQRATRSAVGDVDTVVARARDGRRLSEAAAGQIVAIREGAHRVSSAVEQVAAELASQDQAASGISARAEAISRMSEDSCQVGALSAEVSQNLDRAARALRANVERFRL